MDSIRKPKIFISYSHQDEEWINDVKRHLSVSDDKNQLDIWHDREIDIGEYWFQAIKDAINEANVAIFLISSHFLTSKFIKREEIPEFMRLQKSKGLIIFPLLVSDCDWRGVSWLEELNLYPSDGRALKSFPEPEQDTLLADLPQIIREKFYKSDFIDTKYEDNIKNSPETQTIKKLLKNIDVEFFQKIIYPYLPEIYFGKLPDNVDEIIDKLLGIGKIKDNQVPIICIINELNKKNHHENLNKYITYLKNYWHIEKYECPKNRYLAELSLIVNVDIQDSQEKYSFTTWKYANGKIEQQADLGGSVEISEFLDNAFKYLNDMRNIYDYDKNDIYFEIVLPDEEFYADIKNWRDSNEISLVRKYKYILRLQSRFSQPDSDWVDNWTKIKENDSFLCDEDLCKNIKKTIYEDELSSAYCIAVLEQKIENHFKFFNEIKEFGIPIVLSALSDECQLNDFKDVKIQECKEAICNYIMANHNKHKSELLFVYDDPNKIPETFKQPQENLWGY